MLPAKTGEGVFEHEICVLLFTDSTVQVPPEADRTVFPAAVWVVNDVPVPVTKADEPVLVAVPVPAKVARNIATQFLFAPVVSISLSQPGRAAWLLQTMPASLVTMTCTMGPPWVMIGAPPVSQQPLYRPLSSTCLVRMAFRSAFVSEDRRESRDSWMRLTGSTARRTAAAKKPMRPMTMRSSMRVNPLERGSPRIGTRIGTMTLRDENLSNYSIF